MKQDNPLTTEMIALAELFTRSEAYDEFMEAAGRIGGMVFRDERNAAVFLAVKSICDRGEQVSFEAVYAELEAKNSLEKAGGKDHLISIERMAVSGHKIIYTAQRLLEIYFRNSFHTLGDRLHRFANNGIDVYEAAAQMQDSLQVIIENGHEDRSEKIGDVITRIEGQYADVKSGKRIYGIKSGIPGLDRYIKGGFKFGQYVVIGALPSTGKSNFAFNLLANVSIDVPIGFVSAEMDNEAGVRRILSLTGGFDDTDLIAGSGMSVHDEYKFQQACEEMRKRPIYFNDESAPTVDQVVTLARKWRREKKVQMLVIDYLQHLEPGIKTQSREQAVAMISKKLKNLAKDLKIPVIVLAQLNKESILQKRLPVASDLRESAATYHDADIVILLHSFERQGIKTVPDGLGEYAGLPTENLLTMIVDKQRNGKQQVITMERFNRITGKITSLELRDNSGTTGEYGKIDDSPAPF